MTRSIPRVVVSGALAVLAAGCGLTDYYDRFDKDQARLAAWDEENRLLAPPVQLPSRKRAAPGRQPGPVLEVFLRPPVGIAPTPTVEVDDFLYHYARGTAASNPTPGTGQASDPYQGVEDVYLAVAVQPEKDKDREFVDEVCKFFGVPPTRPEEVAPVKPAGGGPPLQFYNIGFNLTEDAGKLKRGSYSIFFYFEGAMQVAVVFRVAPGRETTATLNKQFQYSLGTLAVGSAGSQKLARYGR